MSMARRRYGLPDPLGETVSEELERLAGSAPTAPGLSVLLQSWEAAVGEAIARNAWPARVTRDGAVVVHASSSAWAFELTQLEQTILERLGAAAPPRLRFIVGPVPEGSAETVSEEHRIPPAPTAAESAAGEQIARRVGPRELREAVARAAAASLARSRRDASTADPSDTIRFG